MGFFEVPDNLDAFEEYEAEQDRNRKMRKRKSTAWMEEEYKEDIEHGDAIFS